MNVAKMFFAPVFECCHIHLFYSNVEARNVRPNIAKDFLQRFFTVAKDVFGVMSKKSNPRILQKFKKNINRFQEIFS